jgi:tetratricopeptide (TPR) repeat protein
VLTKCGEQREADSLMEDVKKYIEEAGPQFMDFYWRCKGYAFVGGQIGDSAVYYLEKQINYRKRGNHEFALNFMLGYAYLLDNNLPEAIKEFENTQTTYHVSSAYITPLYIKGFYLLGQAYEKSNWNEKAVEQYEKFVDIWKDARPPIPEVEDAKKRLDRLKEAI